MKFYTILVDGVEAEPNHQYSFDDAMRLAFAYVKGTQPQGLGGVFTFVEDGLQIIAARDILGPMVKIDLREV